MDTARRGHGHEHRSRYSKFRIIPRRTHPKVTHERVRQIGGDTTLNSTGDAAAQAMGSKKAGKQRMQ